jgi:uncharacterized membrane protein
MEYLTHFYPGIISGIIYAGFILLLGYCLRLLPDTPRAKQVKNIVLVWILLAAIWLLLKPT